MKPSFLIFFQLSAMISGASGATLATYLTGTQSFAASDVADGITAGNMTTTGGEWRNSYGTPGNTPAGPNLGTGTGTYWRLFHGNVTSTTLSPTSSALSATIAASDGYSFVPATLTFDFANAIHAAAASSVTSTVGVYVNGTLFTPVFTLTNTDNNKYKVQTYSVDLSSLGEITSLSFAIAVADDYTPTTGNVGNFIQGVKLEGTMVPEPSGVLLLAGCAVLPALRRRRGRDA